MPTKKNNRVVEVYSLTSNIIGILLTVTAVMSCATNKSLTTNSNNATVISEVTTNQTSLNKKDVVNYFCSNLTEYFNTYKYYKISSETYSERERQNAISTSKITQRAGIYNVEYIGSTGMYRITFSNKEFLESEQIFTFSRGTVLGNAIRKKVYDTFVSWLKRVEINLKATDNISFYTDELNAAVELEKWHNELNQ